MRNLLKTLLIPFFAVIITGSVLAQNQPNDGQLSAFEMASYKTNMMKEALALTDEQVSKVHAINYFCAQMQLEQLHLKNSFQHDTGQIQQVKNMMKAISSHQFSLIRSVLTPDQYRHYAIWQGFDINEIK